MSGEPELLIATKKSFDVHRKLVVWLFVSSVACISVLSALLLYLYYSKNGVTALPTVFLAGILGAFISALRRLYSFHRTFPSDLFHDWLRKSDSYLIIYASIPPIVGGVSAVALYVLFSSGIVKSDMFPEFFCSAGMKACDSFSGFISNWQPNEAADYGKAIIWAFIAGFSERFVPDILSKISAKAED